MQHFIQVDVDKTKMKIQVSMAAKDQQKKQGTQVTIHAVVMREAGLTKNAKDRPGDRQGMHQYQEPEPAHKGCFDKSRWPSKRSRFKI